jgi:hypothetical protein
MLTYILKNASLGMWSKKALCGIQPMPYVIKITPDAEEDMRDASSWYRGRCEGLDVRFLDSVSEAIEFVHIHPTAHGVGFKCKEAPC